MTILPIRVVAAALLHVSMMQMIVNGFAPSPTTRIHRTHCTTAPVFPTSTCLRSTDGNGADDEAQRLKDKANQYRQEAEKLKLTLGLRKIEKLENEIRDFVKGDDSSGLEKRDQDKLQELKDKVQDLVRGNLGAEEADKMLAGLSSFSSGSSATSPPTLLVLDETLPKLTAEEIQKSMAFLNTLPPPIQDTLAKVAGYPSYGSVLNTEEFIQRLYVNRSNKSTETLRRFYFDSFSKELPLETFTSSDSKASIADKIRFMGLKEDSTEEEYAMMEKIASAVEERLGLENSTRAMELFPRNVQEMDEELLPSEEDANVVFEQLGRSFMATERPIKASGGYVIRGVNKRKSAGELVDYLDAKVAKAKPDWTDKYQLSLVEIYSDESAELFEDAILVTANKFPEQVPKALGLVTTAIALFSSFVYCIDAFGENEVVMQRLKDASEVAAAGGVYDITWFNELLIPLLVTLGAAQGFHEAAHYLVAWSKQVSDSRDMDFS